MNCCVKECNRRPKRRLIKDQQELQTMATRGTQDRMKGKKQNLSYDKRTGRQRASPKGSARSGGESGTGLNCKPGTKVSKAVSSNIEPIDSALMKMYLKK